MLWHTKPVEAVLEHLQTSLEGLSTEEARRRLQVEGPNSLPKPKRVTLLKIILHQFTNPLIYILLVAGVLSLVIGEYEDSLFIFAVLLLNALIGTYQEAKAERRVSALQELVKSEAVVLRDGQKQLIDAEQLVRGDIVFLESGTKVPADLRLIDTHNLTIEEALLTGESLPVLKKSEPLPEDSLSVGDRVNLAYAATNVLSGRGVGVVIATGLNTEIGKIAESLREVGTQKVPLVERMERFSRKVGIAVLVASGGIALLGWYQGMAATDVLFTAIALAVSAIPEGLPVALTVALSIATARMARRNVIVRQLATVEGLGSCTYIASDKTGTLTVDQQTAKKILLPSGEEIEITGQGYNGEGEIVAPPALRPAVMALVEAVTLCNEGVLRRTPKGWQYQGDPIDVALLALSYKVGQSPEEIRRAVRVRGEIPFESANKYAATYYEKAGTLYIAAKGAVEVIADHCDSQEKNTLLEAAERLAEGGYRVIAVATGPVEKVDTEKLPQGLTLLGLVGMIDPLKPEAKDAVDTCHRAGIRVGMITGDHPTTALAIARELHIATERSEVITGTELEKIPAKDWGPILRQKTVFARVTPTQKMHIVQALQAEGHFVAVTGDGVNDAPALKLAHIGVAMGSGTDVAKEAADLIVTDNNFSSIAAGVEEGRYAYDNIRKITLLLISTGLAEILMLGVSVLLGLPIPLLPAQLLWLNLVTNGIQDVALAFEKGEKEVMEAPPRSPRESILNRKMLEQVALSGFAIGLLGTAAWIVFLKSWGFTEFHARNLVMLLMVLLENFHALNCRSERKSVFRIPLSNNWPLIGGILVAQGLHISAMYVPFLAQVLQIQPVTLQEWGYSLAAAASILLVMEAYKYLRGRRLN